MPRLSFAEYELINDNIVEFIGDEGVELDLPEAQECHTLYQQLNRPLGVLVNRKNAYSSSLEFVMSIAEESNIRAFAILVPNERSAIVAESQKMFFPIPFQRFFDRDEAINWLKQHLMV